jgi:hypothetical protein
MVKMKISLILLGHANNLFNVNKIRKWKSKIFEVTNIQTIEHLPECEVDDVYLDQKFEKDQLSKLVSCPSESDLAIGIMAYRFVDNFYMHRIGSNCVVVSLHGISDLLSREFISMDNFIVKQIYEASALKCLFKIISTDDVYSLVHRDTRGCLFDLNGDRRDIVYNSEKPILCSSCKAEFKNRQIEEDAISVFESELKKICKPKILQIELFIKKYPLFSVLTTGIIAVSLNLIASALWEFIKILTK